MTTTQKFAIAAACVVAIALRLNLPLLPNFGAMVALSLLCGSVCGRSWALLIPIGVRAITDAVLEWKTGYGFFSSWPFDYSAYVVIALLGSRICSKSILQVSAGTVASVAIYFFVSNFGVWYFESTSQYPRTAAGLLLCLQAGIPFAKGTILGNLLLAPAFFGLWHWASSSVSQPELDVALSSIEKSE